MAAIPANTSKKPAWVKVIASYQKPVITASVAQISNSFIPYFLFLALMYLTVNAGLPYWVTLVLGVLAAGFLLRIFIIQHDCGHQSFFASAKHNDLLGFVCGILTMTPYEYWRYSHAVHHATSGDLDHRGVGDVETKTVKEYLALSPLGKLGYRLYRNPFVMFGIAPAYMFMINQRTPIAWWFAKSTQSKRSVVYTDLTIAVYWLLMIAVVGFDNFVKVQMPVHIIAATVGVWLFYVQHNFEDTYWRAHPEWDYTQAALQGSSYYKLPKILQWFTGNIGLHHIHHLGPKIPNYLLEKVHKENPMFQNVPTITLKDGFKVFISRLALWDEEQKKLISFAEAHRRYLKAETLKTSLDNSVN